MEIDVLGTVTQSSVPARYQYPDSACPTLEQFETEEGKKFKFENLNTSSASVLVPTLP